MITGFSTVTLILMEFFPYFPVRVAVPFCFAVQMPELTATTDFLLLVHVIVFPAITGFSCSDTTMMIFFVLVVIVCFWIVEAADTGIDVKQTNKRTVIKYLYALFIALTSFQKAD